MPENPKSKPTSKEAFPLEMRSSFERTRLQLFLLPESAEIQLLEVGSSDVLFEVPSPSQAGIGERVGVEVLASVFGETTRFSLQGVVLECLAAEEEGHRLRLALDELDRARLVTAVERVEKRILELKEFFKNAKGA